MGRSELFVMRINTEERRMIRLLAQREERTPSDTVRRLIRQAVQNNERAASRQEVGAPAAEYPPPSENRSYLREQA